MTATVISALSAKGFVGTGLPSFAAAIGTGSVLSLVGKTFSTSDMGSTASAGVGVGIGLTGVSSATIKGAMMLEALSKGFTPTTQQSDVFEAVGDALVTELAIASLTSTHTPVYVGTGTIDVGSIMVTASEWGGNIESTGAGLGMSGDKWPDFAAVLGKGCVAGMATAAGNVVITGVPPGTPVPPSGGIDGVGSGVIA
jgi:hypothetical protein